MTLTVGQKLWYVPAARYHGPVREVEVLKVGRKWADISAGRLRIDVETLEADGGRYSSPGQCYLDRVAYETALALSRAWDAFMRRVSKTYSVPEGVTIESIAEASRLLGFAPPHAIAGGDG